MGIFRPERSGAEKPDCSVIIGLSDFSVPRLPPLRSVMRSSRNEGIFCFRELSLKPRLLVLAVLVLLTACVPLPPEGPQAPRSEPNGPTDFAYTDATYLPSIRTVQFLRGEHQDVPPVLFLDEDARLSLEFDELIPPSAEPGAFVMDILACDMAWRPTGAQPLEYYDGFQRAFVEVVGRSRGTRMPYVHYAVPVPAEGAAFKRSGNYLLRVSAPQDSNRVLLTRRLVVAERSAQIQGGLRDASMVADRKHKQRLDFEVLLTGESAHAYDPLQDVQAVVLRNFRWQDAITGLKPRFVEGKRLQFIVPAGEEFDAGNEYRSVAFNQGFQRQYLVPGVEGGDSLLAVELPLDQPRLPDRRAGLRDQNGGFVVGAFGVLDGALSADYRLVQFSLGAPKARAGYRIHVTGGFAAWQCNSENEMAYDPAHYRYTTALLLKEGVVDYAYIAVDETGHMDERLLEGAHSETENVYTVLIYLHAPVLGSPRILGIQQFF